MRKLLQILLLLICTSANAQQINYLKIDSVIQSGATTNRFNAVVLIAEKGKIKYEKAFGYREFAQQVPLKKTDIFELASVSKQFTAMVIMMLKEKGLLQYDDLVEKYLSIPYQGITIRNLLTHTSGLPDYQNISINISHQKCLNRAPNIPIAIRVMYYWQVSPRKPVVAISLSLPQ